MLKKIIFSILLICYISGCSPNHFANHQSTKSMQVITQEASKELEYLEKFLKDYDKSKIDILKKYYFDFDNDGKDELVIFFCDLKNNTYSNVAIVNNNFIYNCIMDSSKKYRFIQPIESELNNKEIQVKLQSIYTQEKLNYHLTLNKINETDISLKLDAKQIK